MTLTITDVSKTYRNGVQALAGVSLNISPGMFGLLGPNGAGKSTLMRSLATLQDPDTGSITFNGIDILNDKPAARRILGYLPQEFGLYPRVTAEDLLHHLATLKGIHRRRDRVRRVENIMHLTNLWTVRKRQLGGFSGGMTQRFGIAQALLNNPRLLIVDEPTAGLDPEERIRFHNILSALGEVTVVILSTHIVSDVSDLCRTMAVIDNGRILYTGTPRDAVSALAGAIWSRTVSRADLPTLRRDHNVVLTRLHAGQTQIHIHARRPPGSGFQPVTPDLHHVYFSVIYGFWPETHL